MSLYAFEHSVVYEGIFILFFILLTVLIGISILSIYRSRFISENRKKINNVRYIVAFCLTIQFLTFLGYYIQNMILHESLWNVWIPSWSLGYILLSSKITDFYVPTKSLQPNPENNRKQLIVWRIIWCLWFGCSLSNWIGSIYGWFLHQHHVQAFGYLLWKFIAFVMLNLCVYMLFNVRSVIKETILMHKMIANVTEKDKHHFNQMTSGYIRIKNLIICELMLSFFLFVSVIYEIYVLINIYEGNYVTNIYAESTVMSMACYFPLWTLIHIVLLIYGWVPRTDMITIENNPSKACSSKSSITTANRNSEITTASANTNSEITIPNIE
eukprot:276320_1